MDLSNKTVLITGAAGLIGSATARLAASGGAELILADIASKPLLKLERELNSTFTNRTHSITADISSALGIDTLVSMALERAGKITSAVHCAYPRSNGWGTKFEELDELFLSQDLSMQLGSAILFSQKIMNYFTQHGGGDLIHVSSIQGIRSPKFHHYHGTTMTSPIEYSAIKAGIIAITGWLAKYHANKGIRVNCVSPGGVLADQPPEFLDSYRQSCTNIGMLSPTQVASSIVFLLSPESVAINGQNLVVDDGWSL